MQHAETLAPGPRGAESYLARVTRPLRACVDLIAGAYSTSRRQLWLPTAPDHNDRGAVSQRVEFACLAAAAAGKMVPVALLAMTESSNEEVDGV